jgi:hypothetical protein
MYCMIWLPMALDGSRAGGLLAPRNEEPQRRATHALRWSGGFQDQRGDLVRMRDQRQMA